MKNAVIIGNYHYNRHSPASFLNCLQSRRIRGVELCPYASWFDITDREDTIRFRKMMQQADVDAEFLVIEQGGVVPFNIGIESEDVEQWSLHYASLVLDNMPALGCSRMMISAGRQSLDKIVPTETGFPEKAACPDANPGTGWERSCRNLRFLGKKAADAGIELLLCSDGSDRFSNIVTNTAQQLDMLRAVGLPNVKAYMDNVSCLAAGEDFRNSICHIASAGMLGHVCIADGPGGWLLPGDGALGPDGIRKAWEAIGEIAYAGSVTLRLQHWRYDFAPDIFTGKLLEMQQKL